MLLRIAVLLLTSTICAHDCLNQRNKDLYLDLMKKCLINSIYQDASCSWAYSGCREFQKEQREHGLDWPDVAHTMIGLHRLNNLQYCMEDVLKNNIPGDFIETGVWRGGAAILMRAVLKVYNITDRLVFAADSFEGLPPSNYTLYPADNGYDFTQFKILAVSLPEVQANFECYGLLDNQVAFLKGWFKDTLPDAPIEKLALMRLDGDLYESTMDALINLYPKLSIGGYVIIDDYSIPCCVKAVHDFRNKFNIIDPIHKTEDNIAAFWKRTQ